MSLEHLFYSDFPVGIRYMCIDGKKITKQEFLELKKDTSRKKKLVLNLREFIQILLIFSLTIMIFLYLMK